MAEQENKIKLLMMAHAEWAATAQYYAGWSSEYEPKRADLFFDAVMRARCIREEIEALLKREPS